MNANDFILKIYGITQNPNTKDYIIVLQNLYCKICNMSGNRKIDNLIQEMQLKITDRNDILFEWVPYNQFDDIKEISKGNIATIYSAIWKDGPLISYDDD